MFVRLVLIASVKRVEVRRSEESEAADADRNPRERDESGSVVSNRRGGSVRVPLSLRDHRHIQGSVEADQPGKIELKSFANLIERYLARRRGERESSEPQREAVDGQKVDSDFRGGEIESGLAAVLPVLQRH